MEWIKQVCSLELAQRLEELGAEQRSVCWWVRDRHAGSPWQLVFVGLTARPPDFDAIAAFTVAELGELLMQTGLYSGYSEEDSGWYCQSSIHFKYDITEEATEADARAKMLIYLLRDELVEPPVAQRA